MSYSHLSIIERGQLETLHRLGWSDRKIGRHLKRHHSTISRELKRGKREESYTTQTAQASYEERRTLSISKGKYTSDLAEEIEGKLHQTWAPCQRECPRLTSQRKKAEAPRNPWTFSDRQAHSSEG